MDHMLWTPAMVDQVKRCWAETLVDVSTLVGDGVENIREAIFYSFENIVKSMVYGVVLDKGDCLFITNEDVITHQTKVRITWNPITKEVEFHGGAAAGMALCLPKMGDPYKVCINHVPEYIQADDSVEAEIPTIIYKYDGWNPNTRRWIYRVK